MNASTKELKLVKAAQWLFFLNAAIWLAIGMFSLVRMAMGTTSQTVTMLVVAFLMFGNVGALLVAGFGIGRRWKIFYFFGMAVLVVNIVLTVTDQFGLLDFMTLVIDLVLFGLMIAARKAFFRAA
jgi:hypothetical protein